MRESVGESSTPVMAAKRNSVATRSGRPLPHPMSTKMAKLRVRYCGEGLPNDTGLRREIVRRQVVSRLAGSQQEARQLAACADAMGAVVGVFLVPTVPKRLTIVIGDDRRGQRRNLRGAPQHLSPDSLKAQGQIP